MNERLKELAEQAGEYANESTKDFTGDEPVVWMDYYTEKFAELIVRECAQVCRDQPNVYAMKVDRDNCAIAIEEHFGVEE